MPRHPFRKSGAALRADRCNKNLDLLGKLSERLYKGFGDASPATIYHALLCHLSPLVSVSAFKEAVDLVLKERFQEVALAHKEKDSWVTGLIEAGRRKQ